MMIVFIMNPTATKTLATVGLWLIIYSDFVGSCWANRKDDTFFSNVEDVVDQHADGLHGNFYVAYQSNQNESKSSNMSLDHDHWRMHSKHQKMFACLKRSMTMYRTIGNSLRHRIKHLFTEIDVTSANLELKLTIAELSLFGEYLQRFAVIEEELKTFDLETPATNQPQPLNGYLFCSKINQIETEILKLIKRTSVIDLRKINYWSQSKNILWKILAQFERQTLIPKIFPIVALFTHVLLIYIFSTLPSRPRIGGILFTVIMDGALLHHYWTEQIEKEQQMHDYNPNPISFLFGFLSKLFIDTFIALKDRLLPQLDSLLPSCHSYWCKVLGIESFRNFILLILAMLIIYKTFYMFMDFSARIGQGLLNIYPQPIDQASSVAGMLQHPPTQAQPIAINFINNYNYVPLPKPTEMTMDAIETDLDYHSASEDL